ncbi:MAG: DUF616 domain-containing protein, partial [Actinobacteria bacterium]|nr:DUF616 domain-containing protein [Actinomycetota bacterium]
DESGHPGWEPRPLPAPELPPARAARLPKLLPHRFLEDAEASVWIDANYSVRCDLDRLVSEALNEAEIAFFAHPQRDCVYEEAEACVRLGKDDPELIAAQMARYRAAGYPAHNGLVAAGVVVRRNTLAVRAFCERWWSELEAGSHRDQLSAPYVVERTGVEYAVLGDDPWTSPRFDFRPHAGQGPAPRP